MGDGASWTKRREQFFVETIIFLTCMVGGLAIVLTGHGVSPKLVGAVLLFVVLVIHLALQLTYFKQVLPESDGNERATWTESHRICPNTPGHSATTAAYGVRRTRAPMGHIRSA
jgi:hypothetical protein